MSLWLDLLGATVRHVDTASFGRIRIVEAGMGRPEALFLMHGIGGHLEAYAKNVLALAEHYHDDVEAATAACTRVRGGQLYVTRADAAHWPQYEAPAEFNEVMHRFLQTGKV